MVRTVPSTHGSWGAFYQAIAMGENIQGIDYRMFKGPEVGREYTGRPVKKLGSPLKKALVKQTSCSGGRGKWAGSGCVSEVAWL